MSSLRPSAQLLPTTREDAASPLYRYVWLPLLIIQLALYCLMVVRYAQQPLYTWVTHPEVEPLQLNHIQNYTSLHVQPKLWLITIHVAMAWCWIAGTMAQKQLVARMARGHDQLLAARRYHATLGWFLCVLGFAGISIGAWIAYAHHANEPMRRFLVSQLLFFLPAFVMVVVTARWRRLSIRHHRFWAECAFLGPAVSSLWTEIAIYVTQRYTSLGPHAGEYWSSVVGGALSFYLVVVPSGYALWRGLKRERSAAAQSELLT